MKKPIVLRIYKGDALLEVKQFLEEQVVIGRPGEVQVALDDASVSVIHAAIEERESGHFVCDLGSEHGTFKNGEKVLDAKIDSGDVIKIGEFRLEFYIGVPKPKAPPPPVAATAAQAPAQTAAQTPIAPKPVDPFEPVAPPADGAAAQAQARPSQKAPVQPQQPTPQPKKTEPVVSASSPQPEVLAASGALSMTSPKPQAAVVMGAGVSSVPVGKRSYKKKKKGQKTFAPPSKHSNIREFVKPSKGTIVEVLVAWKERIISSHHFSQRQTITMGSHPDCDVILPVFASKVRKIPIVKIDATAVVLLTPEMTGELVRGQTSSSFVELLRQNRMVKDGAAYSLMLEQGEMIRIELSESISVIIRYVADSPKPLVAPLLDFTTSEFAGVVLSFVLVAILGLYMFLYTPPKELLDQGADEPLRTAVIIVPKATPAPLPQPERVQVAEQAVPTPAPQVTRATPSPQKIEKKNTPTQRKAVSNLTKKNDPGKSANAAPNKNTKGPRALTSPKQGGSIKTADKEGAQMQAPKKDISKSGVFSVFGGGGAQNELAQGTSGAGELAGLANAATGRAGMANTRAGQGLGSELKDTGRGGTGKALEGIAGGLGTAGRGSGNAGYGTGGLGTRQGVRIVTGGDEESFSGTIDREAVRRVILQNLRVIRTCYERQLNRNPDLMGKIVISWVIGEQGRVVSARTRSNELGNDAVADCILSRLKTWRFPEPPSNQEVEVEAYPFFFSN